jgi:hypothetical protein
LIAGNFFFELTFQIDSLSFELFKRHIVVDVTVVNVVAAVVCAATTCTARVGWTSTALTKWKIGGCNGKKS